MLLVYTETVFHLLPSDSTCWLCKASIYDVFQGGNIYAALSQGQSDEDADMDEEDIPAKKVQYCISNTVETAYVFV